jgi:hypothetical protein
MNIHDVDAKIAECEKFVEGLNADDFEAEMAFAAIKKRRDSIAGEDADSLRAILDEVVENNLLIGSPRQIEMRKSGAFDKYFRQLKEKAAK